MRAYDDSAGVTAKFNRNVLAVVNRELDADFDLDAFEHVARWNADEERIEMWLRATSAQRVDIAALDLTVDFAAGEEMLTEVSCKFRPDGVAAELAAAGLRRTHWWTDPAGDFGLSLSTQMTRRRSRERWRAARPKVAGLHLDSAACSRQSFAVIDAAAQHARHEAEVGGYVAAEAAAPVLDAGRAAVAALTGMSGADVVFTTGSNNALDILLSSWPGERTVACLPGEYGPNLAVMAANGFQVSALPADGLGRLDVDDAARQPGRRPARARAPHPAGQPSRRGPAAGRARRSVPRARRTAGGRCRAGAWVTSTARSARMRSTARRASGWPARAASACWRSVRSSRSG